MLDEWFSFVVNLRLVQSKPCKCKSQEQWNFKYTYNWCILDLIGTIVANINECYVVKQKTL